MNTRPADTLTIALAQINPVVGDVAGNAAKVRAVRERARDADLILFPELFIAGYPPEDLVLKPAFQAACRAAIEELARETGQGGPAHDRRHALARGRQTLQCRRPAGSADGSPDCASRSICRITACSTRSGCSRVGPMPGPMNFRGVRIGVPICEDIWGPEPAECIAETGGEILLVPNGSPYRRGVVDQRLSVAVGRVTETGLPLIYLNQVGGQDELVFEGGSFVLNADASLAAQLPTFAEAVVTTRWQRRADGWHCEPGEIAPLDAAGPVRLHRLHAGLARLCRQERLSGRGARSLGRHRFRAGARRSVSMRWEPSGSVRSCCRTNSPRRNRCPMPPRSPTRSASDTTCCRSKAQFLGLSKVSAPLFDGLPRDVTEENLQARARGTIVMALSNKFGSMVMTTGNKSEMSTGYATLYGDMNGGFNPIKDLYKTEVFRLSALRNTWKPDGALGPDGVVIPRNVIEKPPTAELRENQKDQDSLPPYDILDGILERLVEREQPIAEIVAEGYDAATVIRVDRMLNFAEYKRRQAAPGVKVTLRGFGRDRRYPITNKFRDPGTPLPKPDTSIVSGTPTKSEAFDF